MAPTQEPTLSPTKAPTELCTSLVLTISNAGNSVTDRGTAVTTYNGIYSKQSSTVNAKPWYRLRKGQPSPGDDHGSSLYWSDAVKRWMVEATDIKWTAPTGMCVSVADSEQVSATAMANYNPKPTCGMQKIRAACLSAAKWSASDEGSVIKGTNNHPIVEGDCQWYEKFNVDDDDSHPPGLQIYFGDNTWYWEQLSISKETNGKVLINILCHDTFHPTLAPTEIPSEEPTEDPTKTPTEEPTKTPSEEPTKTPTEEPSKTPTEEPSKTPTEEPTKTPTEEPSKTPSEDPSKTPTEEPSKIPTEEPTNTPTEQPSKTPSEDPTKTPTEEPTVAPTQEPTLSPTKAPTELCTSLALTISNAANTVTDRGTAVTMYNGIYSKQLSAVNGKPWYRLRKGQPSPSDDHGSSLYWSETDKRWMIEATDIKWTAPNGMCVSVADGEQVSANALVNYNPKPTCGTRKTRDDCLSAAKWSASDEGSVIKGTNNHPVVEGDCQWYEKFNVDDNDSHPPGIQTYFGDNTLYWEQLSVSKKTNGKVMVNIVCHDTFHPTLAPTEVPSEEPTEEPTKSPTQEPTKTPSEEPTKTPTEEPSKTPTEEPSKSPTEEPISFESPSEEPTRTPTEEPSKTPTEEPTQTPTEEPSKTPSEEPKNNVGNSDKNHNFPTSTCNNAPS